MAQRLGSSPKPRSPKRARASPLLVRADAVLAAWTTIEVLTPQPLPDPDALRAMRRQLVDLAKQPEPWTLAENRPQSNDPNKDPNKAQSISWFVYLGLLDLRAATASLLELFPDEHADERNYVSGRAPLAVIVLDAEGRPIPGKTFLASYSWGYGQVLANALQSLAEFSSVEPVWRERIEKELIEYAEDGKIQAVTPERLRNLTRWLIRELNVPEHQVELDGVAIRVLQFGAAPEPPEPELLNSFYLQDLHTVRNAVKQRDIGAALSRYMGVTPPPGSRDIVKDRGVLQETLNPARIPLTRWPDRHSLSLMQQAAVNHVIADLRIDGIAGINGPPGTGKTTLLRDVVAKVVVDRAIALAKFDKPAEAFTAKGRMPLGGGYADVYDLHPSLLGHEIVVASSNNGAVENISTEIPSIDAIADDLEPPLRYFSSIADCVATEEGHPIKDGASWGLAAAVLGNTANKTAFANQFWWHQSRSFGKYLIAVANGWSETTADGVKPAEVMTLEGAPRNPQEAMQRWKQAQKAFHEAHQRAEQISTDLAAAGEALQIYPAAQSRVTQAETALDTALRNLEAGRQELMELEVALTAAKQAVTELRGDRDALIALKPGFFARLFRTRRYRTWLAEIDSAKKRLDEALKSVPKALQAKEAALAAVKSRNLLVASAKREHAMAQQAEQALVLKLDRGRELAGAQFPDETFWGRDDADLQRSSPWLGPPFQAARAQLFAAAFNLHRAFIDVSARYLRHNLMVAMTLLKSRSLPADVESVRRSLWASLFLVVPLASTTFASVNRLFGRLGREQLGWLLIDEAGQAAPQAAVGAIWRASRVLSIGDPLQIEPVVTVPPRLVSAIFNQFDLRAEEWAAPRISVQRLGDRASWLGTAIARLDGDLWVGSPLRVNRRCQEPMFSISNQIAYEGLMVLGTPTRDSPIGDVLGPSAWFSVGAKSASKWAPEEGRFAVELLARLLDAGMATPDVFLITPFRAVASSLRETVLSSVRLDKRLMKPYEWVSKRVGTVHTFQGKQAEAVIFVLGAPSPASAGSRNWAGDPPNLLNVAVSRAKERLYVIGERSVWNRAGAFTTLHALLPQ